MPHKLSERFHVAFSFAGEQRPLVKQIAEAVEARLGQNTVFYDDWYEHILAGPDSDIVLQGIYANRAWMVVVCVSEHYGDKPWTQIEHEAIRALNMQLRKSKNESDRLRILPLRVGDGDVPGIPINAICPDARRKSVEETTQLILNRLDCIIPLAGTPSEKTNAAAPAMIADLQHDMGPMDSSNPWYIERKIDHQLLRFLTHKGRAAALLGAPHMGKSSMAIRIERRLQELGYRRVALNIRDGFAPETFSSEGGFFAALAAAIAKKLQVQGPVAGRFAPHAAPVEFATFLVDDVLAKIGGKVIIVLDRLDHLFDQPCCVQSLSALRSLHDVTNKPPYDEMRIILIHTLRPRQHQGPEGSVFDITRKFEFEDFALEEVRYLNCLHGNLIAPDEVPAIHRLLGGHPALTREAWNVMADDGLTAKDLLEAATHDGAPFKPHLRALLSEFQKPEHRNLARAYRDLIEGKGLPSEEIFEALLMLGVVNGSWRGDATVRCDLYANWFPRRLPE